MENVDIKSLYRDTDNYINKEIKISGWVRTVRDSKTFGFIEINDGSFFNNLQVVFTNELSNFDEVCKLSISSTIIVEGTLVKTQNLLIYSIYQIIATLFKRKDILLNI